MSATEAAPIVKVGKRQYDLGPTLGVGGFSEVKMGTDRQTGKKVALKITYTQDIKNQREMNNQLRSVQKEIKSMKKLNHVNIVRLLGYDLKCNVQDKNAIVMVQELAPKGELFDYLMHTNKFEQSLAIAIFHQLVAALSVIHGAGIAHRDLKPENLLFDNNFNLKIVDFGFSYIYKKGDNPRTLMRTELGTKGYMAPEILEHDKYTEAADIFAAGVILFICLAGFPPFQDAKSNDWWFDKLSKKKYRLFWMAHERTAKFSNEAKELIQRMLAADQHDRINVEQIKGTAFYNAAHPDKNELKALLTNRKQQVDQKKAEERAKELSSRDTFQEAVTEYMRKMNPEESLILKSLVQSDLRNEFAAVKQAEDVIGIFETLSSEAQKFQKLPTINVEELDMSKIPDLAKAVDPTQICDTLMLNSENAADQKLAKAILELLDTSSIMGRLDDYDPNLFEQFQKLDDIQLPEFDAIFYKPNSYKTPASLGLILYAFNKYIEKKDLENVVNLSLDLTTCPTITLTGKIERLTEIPIELENGEFELAEASIPVTIELQASVFKQPNSNHNIITFTNGNFHTMEEFLMMENELTTNRDFSLLASILSVDPVVHPTEDLFNVETFDEERHELPTEEVNLVEEEEGEGSN